MNKTKTLYATILMLTFVFTLLLTLPTIANAAALEKQAGTADSLLSSDSIDPNVAIIILPVSIDQNVAIIILPVSYNKQVLNARVNQIK